MLVPFNMHIFVMSSSGPCSLTAVSHCFIRTQKNVLETEVGERERWGGNKAPGPAGTLGKDQRCPEGLFTKFCHVLCDVSLLSASS